MNLQSDSSQFMNLEECSAFIIIGAQCKLTKLSPLKLQVVCDLYIKVR